MSPHNAKFNSFSTAKQVTEGIDASRITAIITGGTSGLGRETARVLALRGAQVVLGALNVEAANQVKEAILQEAGTSARVHVFELDLSSLHSVRKFAIAFESTNLPLNLLINNAAVCAYPFSLSADGIELHFATNYLGHFLLTNLLLEKMKSTAAESGLEGRIINVSSVAHKYTYDGGIRMQTINENSGYSRMKAYGQSKLAMILHSNELAKRLSNEKANVTANSVHPGVVITTNIVRHIPLLAFGGDMVPSFMYKSVAQGASTQCCVALHPSFTKVSGKYIFNCKEANANASAYAKDSDLAERLWKFSMELSCEK